MKASDELENNVDEALDQPSRRSGDAATDKALRELSAAVVALQKQQESMQAQRTQVPASAIKSVRLALAESDLLAGIFESPRTSLLGAMVAVAAFAQYSEPGILGEFVHILEGEGNAGAFGLAAAAFSLLFGRYGQGRSKPADGSIDPAELGPINFGDTDPRLAGRTVGKG